MDGVKALARLAVLLAIVAIGSTGIAETAGAETCPSYPTAKALSEFARIAPPGSPLGSEYSTFKQQIDSVLASGGSQAAVDGIVAAAFPAYTLSASYYGWEWQCGSASFVPILETTRPRPPTTPGPRVTSTSSTSTTQPPPETTTTSTAPPKQFPVSQHPRGTGESITMGDIKAGLVWSIVALEAGAIMMLIAKDIHKKRGGVT